MNHSQITKKLVLSAMFIALGLVLPFFTGQIPQFGKMLLPMHIPVLLCGLIVGYPYGLAVGLTVPILRSLIFGMPALYPTAVAMAAELGTYGFMAGYLYSRFPKRDTVSVYVCLIVSMLAGRVVWGIFEVVLLGFSGNAFTWQAFFAGAFVNAVPGIILQLVLIPAIMFALNRVGITPIKTLHNANKS